MTDGTMVADRGAERACSTPTPPRAWSRSAPAPCSPTSTRSWRGSGWRWRTSATSTARRSPARSRPAPTAPARGCATSPPRSRGSSWSSPTAACASSAPPPTPSCCARPGSGSAPSARSPRSPCAAFPPSPSTASTRPRPREEVLDSFQERADANDHFELFTFPYADSALVLERNRTEAPPRPRGRVAAYLNDVVLENWALEALSATGRRFPRAIPSLSRLAGRLASGSRDRRPQRPRLRQRAPRPLHRDGVRGAARARAGGGAAGDRVGALQPLPGLLPDRDAGRRRRRRPAQPLARARHRLHRRPPVPRHGVAALLRGGRGDHELLRRPPPLGQAPLPDRRDPGAALPGLGRVPGRPRRARPRPRLHQRVRRTVLGP